MAEHQEEICLRLEVLNAQHQPLGGTVDIAGMPEEGASPFLIHAANASENINVRGPARDPNHPYEVTVTPTGTSESVTQLVTVPSQGFPTVQFVFEEAGATASIAPAPSESSSTEVATVAMPISTSDSARHVSPSVPPHTLTGFLVFDHGLLATQIATLLYNIGFAGQNTLLGQTSTQAIQGRNHSKSSTTSFP